VFKKNINYFFQSCGDKSIKIGKSSNLPISMPKLKNSFVKSEIEE